MGVRVSSGEANLKVRNSLHVVLLFDMSLVTFCFCSLSRVETCINFEKFRSKRKGGDFGGGLLLEVIQLKSLPWPHK